MTNCARKSLPLYSALTLATVGLCSLVLINGPASGDRSRYRLAADPHVLRASATVTRSTEKQRVVEAYGRLPLSFEVNRGQTSAAVQFQARGAGYNLFLTSGDVALVLKRPDRDAHAGSALADRGHLVRMRLVDRKLEAVAAGRDELPGRVNYFRGNDPSRWRTDIPTYAKVAYDDVYPGIDLVYYGNQQQLEYDFVVSPGADPDAIRLAFDGAERLEVDPQGDLVLHLADGTLRQRKPIVYQEIDGVRREVNGSYLLADAGVTFELGAYDHARPLVIDPVLVYSTFLGGSMMDQGLGIAVDAAGNAYVTGQTQSANFPTQSAFDTTLGTTGTGTDAVVAKLKPSGSALWYSTYLGGSGVDIGRSIAVDGSFNAYVTGQTFSTNFPTLGAFDTTSTGSGDAFVTKLTSTGGLDYSTYLGGDGPLENGNGIAVDVADSAYVTGQAALGFPTTGGAYDTSFNRGASDAFVTKIDTSAVGAASLVYSTFLGGSGTGAEAGLGIAVDGGGAAYVTGLTSSGSTVFPNTAFPTTAGAFDTAFNGGATDAFVTKLNATGTSPLVYSTFLGGNLSDAGRGIVVDPIGNAYVTGNTLSANFPFTASAFDTSSNGGDDAFVTKLNTTGTAPLLYSTYLGGSSTDQAFGVAVDGMGDVYVTGLTSSANFPFTADALAPAINGGNDGFVTKLNATGTAPLVYSTYLGGTGADQAFGIGMDSSGNAYVTGQTASGTTFPKTPDAFDPTFNGVSDAFVTKFGTPAADVAITKADSPDPVVTGTDLTYTLTVTNNGPDAAVDVTVIDMLPTPSTTYVDGSCSATGGGVCGGVGNNRSVTFAKLASGASATITLVATVDCALEDGSSIMNAATVASSTGDANSSNNIATATTTVSNPAPTIGGASVDKPILWPPNHKMVDITVSYDVSDNCGEAGTSCELTVSSNEPQNGTGDGDTDVDWEIVDAHHVRLRAERDGGGSGRVYTITITCTDSGGGSSTQTVTVTVPKSQGKS